MIGRWRQLPLLVAEPSRCAFLGLVQRAEQGSLPLTPSRRGYEANIAGAEFISLGMSPACRSKLQQSRAIVARHQSRTD